MYIIVKIILLCILALCAVAMIRSEVAFKNGMIIIEAIYHYQMHMIAIGNYIFDVTYDDMMPYGKIMLRFWDFGYTRILPPDKYEIIKPYIVE